MSKTYVWISVSSSPWLHVWRVPKAICDGLSYTKHDWIRAAMLSASLRGQPKSEWACMSVARSLSTRKLPQRCSFPGGMVFLKGVVFYMSSFQERYDSCIERLRLQWPHHLQRRCLCYWSLSSRKGLPLFVPPTNSTSKFHDFHISESSVLGTFLHQPWYSGFE